MSIESPHGSTPERPAEVDPVMGLLGAIASEGFANPRIQPAAEAMAAGLDEQQQEQLARRVDELAAAQGVQPSADWLRDHGAGYRTAAVELKAAGRYAEATAALAGYYSLQNERRRRYGR